MLTTPRSMQGNSPVARDMTSAFGLERRLVTTEPNFTTCDCGFIDAYDPAQAVYTTYYRVDFTDFEYTRKNLTGQFRLANNNVDNRANGGKYIRDYSSAQVALVQGQGVQLTVSPVPSRNTSIVPVAGVYTREYDWGFGSYHLQTQATNITGTVSAFFVYESEENAVVMEYVSKPNWGNGSQFIRDTVAPQIYEENGNPDPATYGTTRLPSEKTSFSAKVHNWGFSWRPESVVYGLDNAYSTTLTTNVPQRPGLVAFSHWSDGNPKYSQGPPTRNATMLTKQIWVLHNSTVLGGPGKNVTYNAMVNGVASDTPVMSCQQRTRPCYVGTPGGGTNGLSLMKPSASGAIKRSISSGAASMPDSLLAVFTVWLMLVASLTLY